MALLCPLYPSLPLARLAGSWIRPGWGIHDHLALSPPPRPGRHVPKLNLDYSVDTIDSAVCDAFVSRAQCLGCQAIPPIDRTCQQVLSRGPCITAEPDSGLC